MVTRGGSSLIARGDQHVATRGGNSSIVRDDQHTRPQEVVINKPMVVTGVHAKEEQAWLY